MGQGHWLGRRDAGQGGSVTSSLSELISPGRVTEITGEKATCLKSQAPGKEGEGGQELAKRSLEAENEAPGYAKCLLTLHSWERMDRNFL